MTDELDREAAVLELNVRNALKHKPTRILMWELLNLTSLNADSFNRDSKQMAFNEGRRSVGLDILSMLETADARIYPNLILENMEKENG